MAAALILPLILGLVLYSIIRTSVRSKGRALQRKFVGLGTLKGRSEVEIVRVVGPPNARSAIANGYLLQWLQPGYHISLIFGADGVCQGVRHQFAG